MNRIVESISFIGANSKNCGGSREKSDIKYLVYHYTGNDGDTAKANARYYRDNVVKASAHYFVDDTSVIQSVGDLTVAWAVGGEKWSDCGKTGGGRLYGVVTNSNSISIEMCDTLKNGELMATEATLRNAVALGKLIMERYGITIDRVVRHFDVTGKHCPAYFMDETAWQNFKARLVTNELEDLIDEMSDEQAYKLYVKAERHLRNLPLPTSWDAAGELRGAVELGITDGSNPNVPTPRYQVAIMTKRAYEKAKRDILSVLK